MAVYVVSFAQRSESVLLPVAAANVVAQECRAAGLEFLEQASEWGKSDLVAWLVGPYRHATRHARAGDRCAIIDEEAFVLTSTVRAIAQRARRTVLQTLGEATRAGVDELAAVHIKERRIVGARSQVGALWIPADIRSCLADRVAALFIVDALLRPRDYEKALFVCNDCEGVSFDRHARASGSCPIHLRRSGVDLSRHAREASLLGAQTGDTKDGTR